MFFPFMIQLLFLINQMDGKYIFTSDLQVTNFSDWLDKNSNKQLQICQKNNQIDYVGTSQSLTNIYWGANYQLKSSSRLEIYIEYQLSGNWQDETLELYANNKLIYSAQNINLQDENRSCQDKYFIHVYNSFIYGTFLYTTIVGDIDSLNIEIKVNSQNLGLYIQNIIICQQTQDGKNNIIPFLQYIPTCSNGLQFVQYYCGCKEKVYQLNQCQNVCGQNYLYDPISNACYYKDNCDSCYGLNTVLVCNQGFYKLLFDDPTQSSCVSRCPNNYFADPITDSCIDMQNYLQQNDNKGCKVLQYLDDVYHFYFYKDSPNFFHFFTYNDFTIKIASVPQKIIERTFIYLDGQFVIGSFETFQFQRIQLYLKVKNSQFKLRFRAIGHFIDFYPSKNYLYINDVLYDQSLILTSDKNQQSANQDYETYYDYVWTRTDLYPFFWNFITFEIEQTSSNGFFYIEDIHLFQYSCQPNCDSCYTNEYCTPCLNPENKNPSDCTCMKGYILQDDICVACPAFCTACTIIGQCDDCKSTTKRLNPPQCDQCPDQYYLTVDSDNCQPCQQGCYQCQLGTVCNRCLQGYFKNQNNQCIQQCADGYFNDGSDFGNPLCTLCDTNCLKCQTTATQCTSCQAPAQLINFKCYSCAMGYYLSQTECVQCLNKCKVCSSIVCQQCVEQYFYQSSTNECVSQCDQNQYSDISKGTCEFCNSSCSSCSGGTADDCLTCPVGKVLNIKQVISGQCSANCLTGFYKNNDRCARCWQGCQSCIDSSQNCLICSQRFYREKSSGFCYQNCPDGYYNNNNGYICTICDSICLTCYGNTNYNCLSCSFPLSLYENQCISECPKGYGSINAICQSCSKNCDKCFGILQNECTTCSTGFYYLHNQCYLKCPSSFTGVRPQYICKCIYGTCVSCAANQYTYNNECYDICPNGTYGFNGLCIKCDITCEMCFGEEQNECLDCKTPYIFFENLCIRECTANTFHDQLTNQCLYCHQSCLACNGPSDYDCTACFDMQMLSLEGNCLDQCPDNSYAVQSENKCYACHPTCQTCFSGARDTCLTCANFFYLNQCVDSCPDGFIVSANKISCEPNFKIILRGCSYQCKNCQMTVRFCTVCSGNRLANPPNCDCDKGYYDDGASSSCNPCANKCLTCRIVASSCVTCKGDRELPHCECPVFYYDDGFSTNCNKCQDNCYSCDRYGCLECLNDRIHPPDCTCPDGYYEAYQPYCQQCLKKCDTCSESEYLCLTCSDIRINPPICNCPDGYFENSDEECQKCGPTCIDCDPKGCLSCAANRVGPIDGICDCAIFGVSRFSIGSVYCTDCQTGVPSFTLNDDFTGFQYNFGGQIQTNLFLSICDLIFDKTTLSLLGSNPTCDTNQNVLFGINPTIQVGDLIQLNRVFILLGCSQPFEIIFRMPLSISFATDIPSHLPIINFNQLDSPNVCAPLTIKFAEKKYNGGQNFQILSWNILIPSDPDPAINSILQANVVNNSEIISFPIQTFQSGTQYKFAVTVKSFSKLMNTLYVQFEPNAHSTITLSSLPFNNQLHRNDALEINFLISYYNCLEKLPPQQNLTYSIILQNNQKVLLDGSITEGLIDGFVQNIPIAFEAYYFNFTNPYTIVFNALLIREDYYESNSFTVEIYIIQSSPILSIEGGNRMIGYSDTLFLNATIKDQDLSPAEASSMIYTCYWSCTDIVNGTECQGTSNQTLQFDNKCQQHYPSKTFEPYKVFNFQVAIMKDQVEYSTKVSIQIIELDLPVLNAYGVDQSIIHNYYDQFILKLEYPGINPDLLMYAGAVIYDNVVKATFQFYYLDFKFKLLDYFTNLTTEIGKEIRLRLSIYDPRYVMPSLNTQKLLWNLPPQFCTLDVQIPDNLIEFIDKVKINVQNCYDADTPLLYSVYLYPNQSIYKQDLIQSYFYNSIFLVPPQAENSFDIFFPYFQQSPQLIIINIEDQQGGITNVTSLISVKEYSNIKAETFLNYLSQQDSLDQQLVAYRIIIERLSRIAGFLDLKETFYRDLIFIDQNQSFQSNQTEGLYHIISIMLGQNTSLLQFNETYFFNQLCYRIKLADQQLINLNYLQLQNQFSSKLNIEKHNYIQQSFTFSNILSQLIKFRVALNRTATEIQSQLKSIMATLQSISVPNEPLYTVSSNSAKLNFGFLTSKMTNEIIGTSLQNEQTKINSTNLYKYSQTRYIDNPFYTLSGFPKNSSGYQAVDPQLQLQNSSDNATILKTPLSFQFPLTDKTPSANTSIKCIAEVSPGNWSANVCKSIQKDKEVICQCDTLNPTSLMESLNTILDKAAQIYSLDTLLAIASFPFYKTIIFYFYLTITVAYVSIIYWGMKVDNAMFTRIQIEKEAEEQKQQEKQDKLEEDEQKMLLSQNKFKTIFQRNNNPRQLIVPQPTKVKASILVSDIQISQASPPLRRIPSKETSLIVQSNRSHQPNKLDCFKNEDQQQLDPKQSKTRAFADYLKFFHQILTIIYKDDPDKPRGLRATIIYTSVMGSLVVLFVFNQPNNLSLTMALALITAPLNKIYQIIIEKLLVHKKKTVRMFGAVIMIVVAAFISYTMLAGLVLSGSIETANRWSYIFLSSFGLDNIFYNPIQLLIQYQLHIRSINFPILQKIFDKLLDDQAKQFMKELLSRIK